LNKAQKKSEKILPSKILMISRGKSVGSCLSKEHGLVEVKMATNLVESEVAEAQRLARGRVRPLHT